MDKWQRILYLLSIFMYHGGRICKGTTGRFFVSVNSMREQAHLLEENFYKINRMELPECSILKSCFKKRTIAIVGGGPSLDEQIDDMKNIENK